MNNFIHPALFFIFGAFLIPVLRGRIRQIYLLIVPALAFYSVLSMNTGVYGEINYLGFNIIMGRVDSLSLVFAHVFTLMAFLGVMYGLHVTESRTAYRLLFLCRRITGSNLCRGLSDCFYLLGNDGLCLDISDLVPQGTGFS